MALSNMYPWVTETRNPEAGECKHNCSYCYMNSLKKNPNIAKKYSGNPKIDEKELNKIKGSDKIIFVGSASDLFGNWVPDEDIKRILEYCKKFDNTYLFQTKNPIRFLNFTYPKKTILGTTIETNRDYNVTKAPKPEDRHNAMLNIKRIFGFPIMISIEPVMDFDLSIFTTWFYQLRPNFVSVGADSKNNKLPEPTAKKLRLFMGELEKITEIKIKSNLKRLM